MSFVSDYHAVTLTDVVFTELETVFVQCRRYHSSAEGTHFASTFYSILCDKYGKPEQSSHSGANGFGVIDIRASRENNAVVSESFSRAHYRSEVSGVAHLRQHNNALVFLPLGKVFGGMQLFLILHRADNALWSFFG